MIEEDLRDLIAEAAPLLYEDEYPADERIYPRVAPPTAVLPYIVYHVIDDIPGHVMDGSSGRSRMRLQVDCWAGTYAQAKDVAATLRGELDNYIGEAGSTTEVAILLESESDAGEPPDDGSQAGPRCVRMDFMVLYTTD